MIKMRCDLHTFCSRCCWPEPGWNLLRPKRTLTLTRLFIFARLNCLGVSVIGIDWFSTESVIRWWMLVIIVCWQCELLVDDALRKPVAGGRYSSYKNIFFYFSWKKIVKYSYLYVLKTFFLYGRFYFYCRIR